MIELIISNVEEKYEKLFPYSFSLISLARKEIQKLCFDSLTKEIRESTTPEEIAEAVEEFYKSLIIELLFSSGRKSAEKGIENMYMDTFCDEKVYNFLMENMKEFRELEKALSEKERESFKKARSRFKAAEVISIIQSCGLSLLFNFTSEKKLEKMSKNPVFKEQLKILTIKGGFKDV